MQQAIGIPGIEKLLVRYPQLYIRIGSTHEYRQPTYEEQTTVLAGRFPKEKNIAQLASPDNSKHEHGHEHPRKFRPVDLLASECRTHPNVLTGRTPNTHVHDAAELNGRDLKQGLTPGDGAE